jgi:hypothetical protein
LALRDSEKLAATGKHCIWNASGFHYFNSLIKWIFHPPQLKRTAKAHAADTT